MSDPRASRLFELTNPKGLYDPSPNGYSHVATVQSRGRFVYVSGQGGETEDGALAPDFRAQASRAFENLSIAVRLAGGDLTDIFKLTVLIVDHSEERLATLVEEITTAFGPEHRPACTLIPVPRLALDGMLFEVEGVAALPDR